MLAGQAKLPVQRQIGLKVGSVGCFEHIEVEMPAYWQPFVHPGILLLLPRHRCLVLEGAVDSIGAWSHTVVFALWLVEEVGPLALLFVSFYPPRWQRTQHQSSQIQRV